MILLNTKERRGVNKMNESKILNTLSIIKLVMAVIYLIVSIYGLMTAIELRTEANKRLINVNNQIQIRNNRK